ncbi:MAG TPA: cob(I)yrinic acid a,c-diamide adenosyltransferase [Bacteroidales bacterium]|nr:cob(I)yrinic acid a,c-diamide adenosyltransferase [Bacteroidales bacterium]HPR57477.1 cob(I)yrinic acid a,c-diamide adenosyltransferase [Bacteroidales bacterium]HRW96508.1 cob(I)yrinic acid a,c-diamide adenosyltransferase [Bacteroidales bacterium]
MPGFIHVYTGNGKGKTTAALGLALRAAGAGKKVFIAQFVKGMHYSELDALKKLEPQITIRQYGRDCFIHKNPVSEDINAAREGLEAVTRVIREDHYDMVILDEATIATYFHLFSTDDLMNVIKMRQPDTEIIVTGRYAPAELIEMADLVTEMTEIKHYYTKGVEAREGIEF